MWKEINLDNTHRETHTNENYSNRYDNLLEELDFEMIFIKSHSNLRKLERDEKNYKLQWNF